MSVDQVDLLFLTDKVVYDLQTLALIGMPYEVCGVVHPHHIIHQYPNTFCGDHTKGFDMEVDIRDDVVAVWHSHPGGLPQPSRDDLGCMADLAGHGYVFPWIIVTNKSVTAWTLSVAAMGSRLVN